MIRQTTKGKNRLRMQALELRTRESMQICVLSMRQNNNWETNKQNNYFGQWNRFWTAAKQSIRASITPLSYFAFFLSNFKNIPFLFSYIKATFSTLSHHLAHFRINYNSFLTFSTLSHHLPYFLNFMHTFSTLAYFLNF